MSKWMNEIGFRFVRLLFCVGFYLKVQLRHTRIKIDSKIGINAINGIAQANKPCDYYFTWFDFDCDMFDAYHCPNQTMDKCKSPK